MRHLPALRRILVPTDHSACAERALAVAVDLARMTGAELHLVEVWPVLGAPAHESRPNPVPESVPHRLTSRYSDAPDVVIVDLARQADLVVMGTHGRRGLRRFVLGSTTEAVLRETDAPVLVVREGAEQTALAAPARLLAPVDFSEHAAVALGAAAAFAALLGGRVDVVHAAHVPDLPEVYGLGLRLPEMTGEIVRGATTELEAVAAEALPEDLRGEVLVRPGPPALTVLDEARRLGSTLLVMSSHGRSGLQRLAFGSVAESVVRSAPCPVLVLPAFGRALPLTAEATTEAA